MDIGKVGAHDGDKIDGLMKEGGRDGKIGRRTAQNLFPDAPRSLNRVERHRSDDQQAHTYFPNKRSMRFLASAGMAARSVRIACFAASAQGHVRWVGMRGMAARKSAFAALTFCFMIAKIASMLTSASA